MQDAVVRGHFRRPIAGPEWVPAETLQPFKGGIGWQSNGGPMRRHPARACPYSIEIPIPATPSKLDKISLVGVFARFAGPESEPVGAIGGTIQLTDGNQVVHRYELIQGRHYNEATDLTQIRRQNGDGTGTETIGTTEIDGQTVRVDNLTLDIPSGVRGKSLVFRDLGTPASFIIFDVAFHYVEKPVCPFRGHGHLVGLSELGGILRLRDRARFDLSIDQLVEGVNACRLDLDEARGMALTFLAVVASSLLEMGASRRVHRLQLHFARELDRLNSTKEIANAAVQKIDELTRDILPRNSTSGDRLVDRALTMIERNFARDLTDEDIAQELGISTSHFRYLFRQATQSPFNKFLMAVRLEKAREILLTSDEPVNEVADHVGFASPAHFSRVFAQRFGVSPSRIRANRR